MKRQYGLSLIECLVYIGVLGVILATAFPALCRCQRSARDLRRNVDDIARALHAGELWRQDVRAATGPVRTTEAGLVIPQQAGNVTYAVADGTVWRRTGFSTIALLKHVKGTAMTADRRSRVTAWRWELELATTQAVVRTRPLFTFEAVPRGAP